MSKHGLEDLKVKPIFKKGRPRKKESEKKDCHISIRLTKEELGKIISTCKSLEISFSKLFRLRFFNEKNNCEIKKGLLND